MFIHKNLFIILLCNALLGAYCFHQPDLVSFADFMEYYLSVPVACSNITDGKNITSLINTNFAKCTTKITSSAREPFANFELICENQEKYLQCWDQLKDDIKSKCQDNGHLPAVYSSTVKSLCANDNGNKTISSLRKAITQITEADQENCPEETGTHWIDNCKLSLETMVSENLCERHSALNACLGKITCLNMEFGRLQKQIYTDGRAYLSCGN